VVNDALIWLQGVLQPGGRALIYWVPLMIIPAACALLGVRNPVEQVREFRPSAWKVLLTVLCLVVSVLFFSGVESFIYANF
jgi:hypothetical protein